MVIFKYMDMENFYLSGVILKEEDKIFLYNNRSLPPKEYYWAVIEHVIKQKIKKDKKIEA